MNKRSLVTAVLFLFLLASSSYGDVQIKEVNDIPLFPQEAEDLKTLWNLYYSSGEISSLEQYALGFVQFTGIESYTADKQSYIVSEILFYTMFARHYCKNYSQSMDDAVTSFVSFLNSQEIQPQSVYALRLFSFLAQKTKPYINVNETQVFDFQEDDVSFTISESVSKDKSLIKLYESYSAVEGLNQRFEKYRLSNQSTSAFLLTQEAFYRILNNPCFVYLILYDGRYGSLLDSFTRSCSSYLNLEERDVRTIFYDKSSQNLKVFPGQLYNFVYKKTGTDRYNAFAAQVYAASGLLSELERNSMLYGFPIDLFFNAEGFQSILSINEDPFYVCCLSQKQIYSLCESLVYAGAAPLYAERINRLLSALPSKGGL